jgi:hypothetical protein
MPTNIVEVDTYTATIQVPNDTEDANQSSLKDTFVQALANRTNRHKLHKLGDGVTSVTEALTVDGAGAITYSAGKWPGLSSRVITRIQDTFGGFSSASWSRNSNGLWVQLTANTDEVLFPLNNLIDGASLTSVIVRVDGDLAGGGSHGGLPATMPRLTVYRRDDGASLTQLGQATDSSSSVGAYDAAHEITVSGLTDTIDEAKPYFASLRGESGANSIAAAFALIHLRATFTTTSVRPGG